MSEREQSYYEIALTHNQVLVAFVVFLSGIVAAFFLGLWIGRDASPPARPPTDAVASAEEPTTEPREFEFFADDGGEGRSSDEREEPGGTEASSTSAEVESTETEDRATEETTEDEGATTLAEDLETPRIEAETSDESEASSRTSAAEGATTRDITPDTRTTEAGGGYIIQVLSSREEQQARDLVSRLRGAEFDARYSAFTDRGSTMHRVRLGPYETRSRAEEVAAELRRRFTLDTWVTGVE